ncbi:hypothetical protein [Bartonella sp. DGB2]|uniref:hypothetical protein n=1 Tax=Bartonella sp. DGB2 TaxID=3388426 RepID=UPI00399025B2
MNTTSSQRLMAGVLAGLFATAIALAILSLHNKVPFLSLLLGGFYRFLFFFLLLLLGRVLALHP